MTLTAELLVLAFDEAARRLVKMMGPVQQDQPQLLNRFSGDAVLALSDPIRPRR